MRWLMAEICSSSFLKIRPVGVNRRWEGQNKGGYFFRPECLRKQPDNRFRPLWFVQSVRRTFCLAAIHLAIEPDVVNRLVLRQSPSHIGGEGCNEKDR